MYTRQDLNDGNQALLTRNLVIAHYIETAPKVEVGRSDLTYPLMMTTHTYCRLCTLVECHMMSNKGKYLHECHHHSRIAHARLASKVFGQILLI